MARLKLTLLGGFEARIIPGEPLDIATRKARALLAYLALPTGRAHSRDKLMGLLWSDRGDEQARNSLRQALAELGRVLVGVEPSPLVKGRDTLALDPQAVEVDAIAFEHLAASQAADDLRHAMGLYAGELLDGFTVRDLAFDEWLREERQRYDGLAITTLKKLVPLESPANALALAQRLVTLAPLQEDGHRMLMHLHAEAGNIGAALHQYEACRDMLKRELAVGPSAETGALHRRIRESSHADEAVRPRGEEMLAPENLVSTNSATSKLSVAVLPFQNLSDDAAQRYFSDGITEDIITELSRFRSLTVIARHSSFAFRDASFGVTEVARKLDVQYVIEGSVRRMLDRVRITARLVDAETGSQLWSEHYDRETAEVFAIQDEVVQAIVAVLPGRIEEAGARSARRKRPESLAAYDYLLRGIELTLTFDFAYTEPARKMFEEAIAVDARIAPAYAWLAILRLRDWWTNRSAQSLDEAFTLAKRAVEIDGNDGFIHGQLGVVYLERRSFDEATFHIERFVALNPNHPAAPLFMSQLLTYVGRAQEGITWIERAFRLNPFPPQAYNSYYGMILFAARRYAESIATFNRILAETNRWYEVMYLVADNAYLGRLEEARTLIRVWAKLHPDLSLLAFAAKEPFKQSADLDHLLEGLRIAGISN
jgi:TolB-like protein/tetratricopeptide (TPR) repeat protein